MFNSFGVVTWCCLKLFARPTMISIVENEEPEQANLGERSLQHSNPGQGGKAVDQILYPAVATGKDRFRFPSL